MVLTMLRVQLCNGRRILDMCVCLRISVLLNKQEEDAGHGQSAKRQQTGAFEVPRVTPVRLGGRRSEACTLIGLQHGILLQTNYEKLLLLPHGEAGSAISHNSS